MVNEGACYLHTMAIKDTFSFEIDEIFRLLALTSISINLQKKII